jgi:hypothetical protein
MSIFKISVFVLLFSFCEFTSYAQVSEIKKEVKKDKKKREKKEKTPDKVYHYEENETGSSSTDDKKGWCLFCKPEEPEE